MNFHRRRFLTALLVGVALTSAAAVWAGEAHDSGGAVPLDDGTEIVPIGQVAVRFVDATGAPLENVEIDIDGRSLMSDGSTQRISVWHEDSLILFSKRGFAKVERRVHVEPGATTQVNVTLTRSQ
jgi:hypothetical protein